MKKISPLTFAAAAFLLAAAPSHAQVFVKPIGFKAIPLRVQKLRADVEINGAIAITRWSMDIRMENVGPGGYNSEGVCEFICARPSDAKVTAFKIANSLTGRVEESLAVAPRVAFRADPSDPLLRSRLNASNSFRATVYPLNGWDGVTVSGTWVQNLRSTKTGATFQLPLLALKGITTRLTQLDAKITLRGVPAQAISNNYHLPFKNQGGLRVLSLSQKNYRVLRDLNLTFKPSKPFTPMPPIPMLVSPGTRTTPGHIAFAFIAPRYLKNLTLAGSSSIFGIQFSARNPRQGEIVQVSGYFNGEQNNIDLKLSLPFSGFDSVPLVSVVNPIAAPLWATQKINALSADAKANRAQIIALSKQFSVQSAFTSWLATTTDDLRVYRYALLSAQLDTLVQEYWKRISEGQEKGARVTQIKNAVTKISVANNLNVEDELYIRLGEAYEYALSLKYSDYLIERTKPKPTQTQIAQRIARLSEKMLAYVSTQTGKEASRGDRDWHSPLYYGELTTLRDQIMDEYRKPHPNYDQLKAWELRFARLYGSTKLDPRPNIWITKLKAREIEVQVTAAEQANDQARLSLLQNQRYANARQVYFTNNIGDPPIYVDAPADARQVVAVMPDGQVKTLDYNAREKRWEGNYDVPVGTKDGDYAIQILIVNADGTRHRQSQPFRVDTTPPTGQGTVELLPTDSHTLRLEVKHGGDVAFVTAFTPWGTKANLLPSTQNGTTFFGTTPIPQNYEGKPIQITYILTDRAHNAISIQAQTTKPTP